MERNSNYPVEDLKAVADAVALIMAIPFIVAYAWTGVVLAVGLWLGLKCAVLLISTAPNRRYDPYSPKALTERERWARDLGVEVETEGFMMPLTPSPFGQMSVRETLELIPQPDPAPVADIKPEDHTDHRIEPAA